MFRVSTKGDYALLIMTSLAEKFPSKTEAFHSLKEIARQKHLSFSYISQLILPLKKAGLVEAKEGIYGGYRLAKDPSQISLMEILEALEGKIAPVKCTNEKNGPCQCEGVCAVKYAWHDAIELLYHYFRSRKLSDVVKRRTSDIANITILQ